MFRRVTPSVRSFATAKVKKAASDKPAKSNKFKSVSKKSDKGSDSGKYDVILRALKGRDPEPFEWTEQEKQEHFEIGRTYNRMTSLRHNELMKDLQMKINLKWEAINALPTEELRQEALVEDFSLVTNRRGFPTWTPPIPGFKRFREE
ncbi:unnamed protein product [Aphanomyces euteiches]|uniref:Uncharacterized protein n=1 Tax=Aphanomyces euteiches TaxID=100861 RepID=A0A6G0XRQ8_9STRA|nr:hypothetical protein Ae201684_002192 [Aphanomyces euteiches]KAH9087512.1 hypothetical protein Ae201684P_000916 [Aphanomyces euteiches]KAH9109037.1 hypothetical protein AeMF1_015835 [Aphanomyces euteiches]KAH9131751.1 hypothetical protein AeRB84_021680 [Aphanomyces euteiches]KAH9164452.1 hypothetical protein LEN26_000029 [Aphanomyces euteiches]